MPSMAQIAARRMRQEYRNGTVLVHKPDGVKWGRSPVIVYHKSIPYRHCGVYVFEDDTVLAYRDWTKEAHVARRHEARAWLMESKLRYGNA